MMLPLTGITVLDFTQVVSGAYATTLLADFGADVIKVESAGRLDPGRRLGPFRPEGPREPDGSVLFASLNRNKRSVAINLKHPEGVGIARRLAERCDVVVENFSAGVMQRLGLGPEELLARNPRLVYLSMSGFGQEGPRAAWVSFNVVLQAMSGLLALTGSPDDPPLMVANSWADYVGGLQGTLLVLAGLARREAEGRGFWIDMSQHEANVLPLGHLLLARAAGERVVERWGNRSPVRAPQGSYRCRGQDAWCVISVGTEEEWRALVEVMQDPVLRTPRYDSLEARQEEHDLIDSRIEAWTRERAPREVEEALRRAGIPAAAVRSAVDVLAEISGRPGFQTVPHPVVGEVPLLPNGISLDGGETPRQSGPVLGADTAAVLRELLAIPEPEMTRLRARGALA